MLSPGMGLCDNSLLLQEEAPPVRMPPEYSGHVVSGREGSVGQHRVTKRWRLHRRSGRGEQQGRTRGTRGLYRKWRYKGMKVAWEEGLKAWEEGLTLNFLEKRLPRLTKKTHGANSNVQDYSISDGMCSLSLLSARPYRLALGAEEGTWVYIHLQSYNVMWQIKL